MHMMKNRNWLVPILAVGVLGVVVLAVGVATSPNCGQSSSLSELAAALDVEFPSELSTAHSIVWQRRWYWVPFPRWSCDVVGQLGKSDTTQLIELARAGKGPAIMKAKAPIQLTLEEDAPTEDQTIATGERHLWWVTEVGRINCAVAIQPETGRFRMTVMASH
jgi:hypothetical protein